jgi:hypothetical protein
VTFEFASGSTDPCVSATNADGFVISGVTRSDGVPDPNNKNYGITCAVALNSGGTAYTLTVTTTTASAASAARRPAQRHLTSLDVILLGVPGMVLLGLGASRIGSRRARLASKLFGTIGILVIISALVFLPACGGGISGTVVQPGSASAVYFLTLTGADGSGTQQTYIVPLNVLPSE